jgi:trimethylamine--corrinoid protein Co-methyltransferase
VTGIDNGEGLKIDLLDEVGPGGEFVSHSHTLRNFKDSWYPNFIDRSPFNNQELEDIETLSDRANEYVKEFFENDEDKPKFDGCIRDDLELIQDEFSSRKTG